MKAFSLSMSGDQAVVAESATALLSGLIDYAGLFPPASLGIAAAVANYDAYLSGEYSWMLGRFIVPVARLEEFQSALADLPAALESASSSSWGLSVLPGADVVADVSRIREFNDRLGVGNSTRRVRIESIEVRIASAVEIEPLSALIPAETEIYFEIPLTADVGDCIAAVADCGRRAKIRTGGETADKFPAAASVVEFMRLCAAKGVAFKATAGLHHPIRSAHRLTYQADSPTGMMHGFLNVFLAAAFLRAGMDARLAADLVNEQSASAFRVDSTTVVWRENRLSLDDILAARRNFAISFGSCSFTEPVEDLRGLCLLPQSNR
ncbi:MAG: hypothetical protein WBV46_16740 [Terriglobales bacterium]|jgi:hypothetical protein